MRAFDQNQPLAQQRAAGVLATACIPHNTGASLTQESTWESTMLFFVGPLQILIRHAGAGHQHVHHLSSCSKSWMRWFLATAG